MAPDSNLKDVLKTISDADVLVVDATGGAKLKLFTDLIQLGQDVPVLVADGSALLSEYVGLDAAAQADLDAYVYSLPAFSTNPKVDGIAKQILVGGIAASAVVAALKGI
jgi:hypothetical protein